MIWRHFKNGREIGRAGFEGTFLNALVRKDFTIKITFQQTPRGDKGKGMWLSGGKSIAGRANSKIFFSRS